MSSPRTRSQVKADAKIPLSQSERVWYTSPTVLGSLVLALGALIISPFVRQRVAIELWDPANLPSQVQIIDPRQFAVLDKVATADSFNGLSIFVPPGTDEETLIARPFHIYHPDFYAVIGDDPTLTLVADGGTDPLFHEANVWFPPTDEMFFVQNAGAPAAGTGMAKSAIVQKISLAQAGAVSHLRDARGQVEVVTVPATPEIVNPNGGTNYHGEIVFAGEGRGAQDPSTLYLMHPYPPYNTTPILNNFFGRQFNSLNDVAVNPRNRELYFTDVDYGYLQDFRPPVQLRNQVYRFDPETGIVAAVADGFDKPNGLTFSPDGKWLYVCDTGMNRGFQGFHYTHPATIYRLAVNPDGSLGPSQVFAFVHTGVPDGIHCDTAGNVYSGVGDGIHVWNPAGTLIGKIFVGETSANFQFAGNGRMVICAETHLYYVTLAAEGMRITDY